MSFRTGTLGEFAAWTKRVVRDPKAAKGVPKQWVESSAAAAGGREISPEAMVKLLSPGNVRLLATLDRERPASVRALADLVGRNEASVSRTLKRLAQAGIVAMRPGKDRKIRPELIARRVQLEIDLTGAEGRTIAVRAKKVA